MKNPIDKARPSKWHFISHVADSTSGTRLEGRTWRNLQLRKETTTRRANNSWGASRTFYYVKGQKKSFKTMIAFIKYLKQLK